MSSGEIIVAVEEAAEGGYVTRALGHDISTEADTIDTLREAVWRHFDEGDRPKVIRLRFVREEVIAAEAAARRFGRGSRQAPAPAGLPHHVADRRSRSP